MGCIESGQLLKFLKKTTNNNVYKLVPTLQLCIRICLSVLNTHAAYEHGTRECFCLDESSQYQKMTLAAKRQIKNDLIANCLPLVLPSEKKLYEIHRTGFIGKCEFCIKAIEEFTFYSTKTNQQNNELWELKLILFLFRKIYFFTF